MCCFELSERQICSNLMSDIYKYFPVSYTAEIYKNDGCLQNYNTTTIINFEEYLKEYYDSPSLENLKRWIDIAISNKIMNCEVFSHLFFSQIVTSLSPDIVRRIQIVKLTDGNNLLHTLLVFGDLSDDNAIYIDGWMKYFTNSKNGYIGNKTNYLELLMTTVEFRGCKVIDIPKEYSELAAKLVVDY